GERLHSRLRIESAGGGAHPDSRVPVFGAVRGGSPQAVTPSDYWRRVAGVVEVHRGAVRPPAGRRHAQDHLRERREALRADVGAARQRPRSRTTPRQSAIVSALAGSTGSLRTAV